LQLAACKEHKVYLMEKVKGSIANPTYAVHPIALSNVLYAGSPQFTSMIEKLGGHLGYLPDQVVLDLRIDGPHVISSSGFWESIQYRENDSGQKKKLCQWKSNYECKVPAPVKESWAALRLIVRLAMAKLLGIPPESLSDDDVDQLYSKLITETTLPQPPHLDYARWLLSMLLNNQHLYLAVFPLTPDGMMLQVWNDQVAGVGRLLFLPMNSILILPGNTVHGGGFMTAPGGNLRGHLYIAVNHNLPKGVKKVVIPSGNDRVVDYTVNNSARFHPAKCLVRKGLVKKYGPCLINNKVCFAKYRTDDTK
jgi:hypothetical protein